MRRIFLTTLVAALLLTGCARSVEYDIKSSSAGDTISGVSNTSSEESSEDESAPTSGYVNSASANSADETSSEVETICVYVCGSVASPGIYNLKDGSRVYEAIKAAGGLLEGVDETGINMAEKLSDGQQITVSMEGADTSTGSSDSQSNSSVKVNINTASKEELMTLSGIGEARADEIISYRSSYGRFDSIDEIMNISGIGEKMFEKIKESIEV